MAEDEVRERGLRREDEGRLRLQERRAEALHAEEREGEERVRARLVRIERERAAEEIHGGLVLPAVERGGAEIGEAVVFASAFHYITTIPSQTEL
jgi:hypothetical protein